MKRIGEIFFVVLFLFASISFAQKIYSAKEAKNHIGEKVIVKGTIDQVHTTETGTTFLNIDGEYPDNVFTIVIFKSDSKKFPNVESYEGKKVEVSGTIKEYRGKPEIILRTLKNIRIIEE